MKQTLFILLLIFFSCSSQQEQTTKNISSDTLKPITDDTSKFILTETNICEQTNLSNQFDIIIDFKRYTDTIEIDQKCLLKVVIKDKLTKAIIDSFTFKSTFLYSFMFLSCDSMTSYTTNFKADREIADNYFGDIVVADLNFDGYDDIAVVSEGGGNGGPIYSFLTQTQKRKFIIDNFLTDSVSYFPTEIDKEKKQLTTYVHAGACCLGEHIYQLNKPKNNWRQISHKILKNE